MESAESFRDRLDAVNRELGDILSHNASVKDKLADERARAVADRVSDTRSYAYAGDYTHLLAGKIGPANGGARYGNAAAQHNVTTSSSAIEATFAAAAAAPPVGGTPTLISTSHDVLRREVRDVVAAEMQQQNALLQGIVQREWDLKLREVDGILRSRFGELRSANEALQRVVGELADEVTHVNTTMANRIEKSEADLSRKIAALKREHEEALRQVKSEVRELSDTLVSAKLDATAVEKRFDELGHKLQDSISSSMRVFDSKWNGIEDQIEQSFRTDRKQHVLFSEKVEKALHDHEQQLKADAARLGTLQQEVNAIGEEGVGLRSQMRTTRGELNQLEMLVRSVGVRQQQQSGAAGSTAAAKLHLDPLSLNPTKAPTAAAAVPTANQQRDDAPWYAGSLPFGEGIRLQQDVYALKQSVAYLADVVERRLLNGAPSSSDDSSAAHRMNHQPHHLRAGGNAPHIGHQQRSRHSSSPHQSSYSPPYSPTRYRVPESDEESNANLARSSID